jgi:N-acetyl-gamma-glutamyl-phosphate reductase
MSDPSTQSAAERGGAHAVPVAIVGASGYTGAELLRLLLGHPGVRVEAVCGHGKAGQPIAEVLPSFAGVLSGEIEPFDADRIARVARAAFCALPHAASAPIVDALRSRGVTVFDLSADFRLREQTVYEQWYGPHPVPARLQQAAYGLVELHRESVRSSDLIAVPGCYPTAAVLALAPLVQDRLVDPGSLIIDAKTGVSGAGRTARANTHLPEAAEGVRAYKSAGGHRHVPEIEQELARLAGKPLRVTFTPHLVPMTRGILTTIYASPAADGQELTSEACSEAARGLYQGSPSVVVLEPGTHPDTLWIRGSNRVHLSYAVEGRTGRVLVQATVDNLVKGAAGQAVQCLNVRYGFDEGQGLYATATWP